MRLQGLRLPLRGSLLVSRNAPLRFQSSAAEASPPVKRAVGHDGHKPLSALASAHNHEAVEREWAQMRDRATSADYAVVMSSRLRSGKGASVPELVQEMRQKGIPLTAGVYKCLMQRYRDTGEGIGKFDALWDEMRDRKVVPKANMLNLYLEQLRDSVRKASSSISSSSSSGGGGGGGSAEDLPARMWRFCSWARKTFDVVGDVKTFELVLAATAEPAHQPLALDVLQQMKKDNVPIALCHALHFLAVGLSRRSALLVTAGYDRCMELDPKAINEGTWMEIVLFWAYRGNFVNILATEPHLAKRFPESQPSEAFYRLAVHAMTKVPTADHPNYAIPWVELFRTLHRLEDRGYSLHEPLLMHRLLGPFDKVENLDAAFYALEDMRDSKTEAVRLSDLNLVVRGCGRAADLDRGLATLAEIPKFGLAANADSFAALLKVCVSCKDTQAGLGVVAQMETLGIQPDVQCKKILAALFCTPQHVDRAAALVREIGGECPPEVAHSTIWLLMRAGRQTEADSLREWYQAANPAFKFSQQLSAALRGPADEGLEAEDNVAEAKQ